MLQNQCFSTKYRPQGLHLPVGGYRTMGRSNSYTQLQGATASSIQLLIATAHTTSYNTISQRNGPIHALRRRTGLLLQATTLGPQMLQNQGFSARFTLQRGRCYVYAADIAAKGVRRTGRYHLYLQVLQAPGYRYQQYCCRGRMTGPTDQQQYNYHSNQCYN